MGRNGDDVQFHHCMQSHRLIRIETDLAAIEARRQQDVTKTMEVLQGMVGQLSTALGFFDTVRKQVKLLFVQTRALARELERQKKRRR